MAPVIKQIQNKEEYIELYNVVKNSNELCHHNERQIDFTAFQKPYPFLRNKDAIQSIIRDVYYLEENGKKIGVAKITRFDFHVYLEFVCAVKSYGLNFILGLMNYFSNEYSILVLDALNADLDKYYNLLGPMFIGEREDGSEFVFKLNNNTENINNFILDKMFHKCDFDHFYLIFKDLPETTTSTQLLEKLEHLMSNKFSGTFNDKIQKMMVDYEEYYDYYNKKKKRLNHSISFETPDKMNEFTSALIVGNESIPSVSFNKKIYMFVEDDD